MRSMFALFNNIKTKFDHLKDAVRGRRGNVYLYLHHISGGSREPDILPLLVAISLVNVESNHTLNEY